jgi:hypothetical protein
MQVHGLTVLTLWKWCCVILNTFSVWFDLTVSQQRGRLPSKLCAGAHWRCGAWSAWSGGRCAWSASDKCYTQTSSPQCGCDCDARAHPSGQSACSSLPNRRRTASHLPQNKAPWAFDKQKGVSIYLYVCVGGLSDVSSWSRSSRIDWRGIDEPFSCPPAEQQLIPQAPLWPEWEQGRWGTACSCSEEVAEGQWRCWLW